MTLEAVLMAVEAILMVVVVILTESGGVGGSGFEQKMADVNKPIETDANRDPSSDFCTFRYLLLLHLRFCTVSIHYVRFLFGSTTRA